MCAVCRRSIIVCAVCRRAGRRSPSPRPGAALCVWCVGTPGAGAHHSGRAQHHRRRVQHADGRQAAGDEPQGPADLPGVLDPLAQRVGGHQAPCLLHQARIKAVMCCIIKLSRVIWSHCNINRSSLIVENLENWQCYIVAFLFCLVAKFLAVALSLFSVVTI